MLITFEKLKRIYQQYISYLYKKPFDKTTTFRDVHDFLFTTLVYYCSAFCISFLNLHLTIDH